MAFPRADRTCGGRALVASADVAGTVFACDQRPDNAALGRWQSSAAIHCCVWADRGRRLAVGTDAGLWFLEVCRSNSAPSNGSASDGKEQFDPSKWD